MLERDMTGEEVFWRYASACVGRMALFGHITDDRLQRIHEYVKSGKPISHHLLNSCFPLAYWDSRKYARTNGLAQWDRDTQISFWRYEHRRKSEKCRAHRGRVKAVIRVEGIEFSTAIVMPDGPDEHDTNTYKAANIHRLSLEEGDTVYVHHFAIAEGVRNGYRLKAPLLI